MFLVNVPFVFAAVWSILQMFVDERVKVGLCYMKNLNLGHQYSHC